MCGLYKIRSARINGLRLICDLSFVLVLVVIEIGRALARPLENQALAQCFCFGVLRKPTSRENIYMSGVASYLSRGL